MLVTLFLDSTQRGVLAIRVDIRYLRRDILLWTLVIHRVHLGSLVEVNRLVSRHTIHSLLTTSEVHLVYYLLAVLRFDL